MANFVGVVRQDGFNRLVLDYVGEVAFDTRYDSLTDKKADVLEVS